MSLLYQEILIYNKQIIYHSEVNEFEKSEKSHVNYFRWFWDA